MQFFHFIIVFNEEINIFAIFYEQKSREEEFKYFEGKLMQKLEEKILKKKWKKWTAHLARKKLTTNPKGELSTKARTKPEVSVKIRLSGAYIRRRKQKEKTHRVSKLVREEIQSSSLSLRGNFFS